MDTPRSRFLTAMYDLRLQQEYDLLKASHRSLAYEPEKLVELVRKDVALLDLEVEPSLPEPSLPESAQIVSPSPVDRSQQLVRDAIVAVGDTVRHRVIEALHTAQMPIAEVDYIKVPHWLYTALYATQGGTPKILGLELRASASIEAEVVTCFKNGVTCSVSEIPRPEPAVAEP